MHDLFAQCGLSFIGKIEDSDIRFGECPMGKSLPIPPKEELEALAGESYELIARRYRISPTPVIKWFKHYGIQRKKYVPISRRPEVDTLKKLKGHTLREIGEIYGVSAQTVGKWYRILSVRRENLNCFAVPSKNRLEHLNHLTLDKISEMCGVSRKTVSGWYKFRKINKLNPNHFGYNPLTQENVMGKTVRVLSKEHHASVQTIYRWLRAIGNPQRYSGGNIRFGRVPRGPKLHAYIHANWVPSGLELEEICKMDVTEVAYSYRVSDHTVRQWLLLKETIS